MQDPDDLQKLILQGHDLLEQTRRILAANKQKMVRYELHESITSHMKDANEKPPLPAEEIKPDAAITFARQVRRRRTIV